MIDLNKFISEIDEPPPMVNVLMELMQASNDPEAPLKDMVELINNDPALTTKVLKLCNSSYYGLPGQIVSVQKALVYIGTNTLVNFVLAGYMSSFYLKAQACDGFYKGDLWPHSVRCAVASRYIANIKENDPDNVAFTAGLIHDVGKVVLYPKFCDLYEKILTIIEKDHLSFDEAEEQVLGCTSSQAGAALARHWQFPDQLIDAIANHKTPDKAEFDPVLVSQVHLADILSETAETDVEIDLLISKLHPFALEKTGFDTSELSELIRKIMDELNKAEELLALAA